MSVVTNPPIRFRRAKGMRALPKPQPGGSLLRLRKLINIGDDDNWIILVAWLVAACRPNRALSGFGSPGGAGIGSRVRSKESFG